MDEFLVDHVDDFWEHAQTKLNQIWIVMVSRKINQFECFRYLEIGVNRSTRED